LGKFNHGTWSGVHFFSMPRARPIAVEPLEPRLQFAACPAGLPVMEHTRRIDFAPAAESPAAPADLPAASPDIEITLEDGTVVPAEPPDSSPTGTSPVIDFGAIVRKQQATAKAFLIKNLGASPLSVGDVTLPQGFVLVQAPPSMIAPGESGKVVIGLDPTASGAHVGPVVVASDDPDEPLLSFRISGEVLPPPISVTSIDARRLPPALVAGSTTPRRPIAVTLRNDTDLPFSDTVVLAAFASSDATLDAGDTKLAEISRPLHLAAGRTRTLKLMLAPDAFPAGDATLIASATAAGATDSSVGPQVSVRRPFVRLTSRAASAPTAPPAAPVSPGKPVRLAIPIKNDGNVATAPTPATFRVDVTAAADDGSGENVVASASVTSKLRIPPGTTRRVKLAVTFPAGAFPPGAYPRRGTVNAENNETNDTLLLTVPIQFA
jgi:hypothetical protein